MRRRLAQAVIEEMDRRKRVSGDPHLRRPAHAPARRPDRRGRGPAACRRLSGRYDVVLVDEFQDTDPVQWEILDLAFSRFDARAHRRSEASDLLVSGSRCVRLPGRSQSAAQRATLSTNWRSDQGLIDAYDALFSDAQLGHAGHRVPHGARRSGQRRRRHRRSAKLHPAANPDPRSPQCRDDQGRVRKLPGRAALHSAATSLSDITSLLSSDIDARRFATRSDGASRAGAVPAISPSWCGPTAKRALYATHFTSRAFRPWSPVAGSVFESPPATEWVRLFDRHRQTHLADDSRGPRLSHFSSAGAPIRSPSADDEDWEELHWRLHRWVGRPARTRVAALLEHVLIRGSPCAGAQLGLGRALLDRSRPHRPLLHSAAVEQNLGPAALTAWLRRRIAEAADDRNDEDRSLRLESDAEAVQVLTIHRSKGLEFPIVYCPYLWDGY